MFATILSDRYAVNISGGQYYFDASAETKLIIASSDTKNNAKQKNFQGNLKPKFKKLLDGQEKVKIRNIEFVFGNDTQSMIENLKDRIRVLYPFENK